MQNRCRTCACAACQTCRARTDKLYEEMELPLARTLAKMELAGIKPDAALLDKLTKEMAAQIAALEILAVEQAGESFNLKSTKQLGAILFEKLGLPVIKKLKQVIPQTYPSWSSCATSIRWCGRFWNTAS